MTRQGRDSVCVKACLAGRLADIRRLSGSGLGRAALGVLSQMPELRRLCLLGGERRRVELELELPQLETLRIEGYQIAKVGVQVEVGQGGWVWRTTLDMNGEHCKLALPHLPEATSHLHATLCVLQLRLPVCLHLHTVVLSGHGVCAQLALPPSTRVLVLDNVMRDARTLSLATMVCAA